MANMKTRAEARESAIQSDLAPLYAVAGLTGALTEVLRAALADTQQRTGQQLSRLQGRGADARKQATESATDLRTFVITLPEQVMSLPEATRARIAELQQQADELRSQANSAYGEFAGRGRRAVDDVMADLGERVDPAFERVQETVTQARKTITGHTATKTMTPRSAAKASATRKAPAKKAPVKKARAKAATS
jgi:protein involved in temperature-dependent protein secretion